MADPFAAVTAKQMNNPVAAQQSGDPVVAEQNR